jgi:hypothetical protein
VNFTTRSTAGSPRLKSRVLEGLREVGLLLIAFASLEGALRGSESDHSARFVVVFLSVGMLLFGMALVLDWRMNHVGEL